jgi:hypothetical protein
MNIVLTGRPQQQRYYLNGRQQSRVAMAVPDQGRNLGLEELEVSVSFPSPLASCAIC